LDAGHEVAGGHVTEMSQLVTLLVEKGFCTDLVDDIYNNIATVTTSGLAKFSDEQKVKNVISQILAEALKGSGSSASITDDFIKLLEAKAKTEGGLLELPFSSPSVKNKFATSICAAINTAALRRKYAGLGTVQTPSYGQMMTANLGGYDYTFEQVVDQYRGQFTDYETLFYDPYSYSENIITDRYLEEMQNVKSKNGVAVISRIIGSQINFEDTIIYRATDGKLYVEQITDISQYYKFRRNPPVELYK
jgi:hypothetical protein